MIHLFSVKALEIRKTNCYYTAREKKPFVCTSLESSRLALAEGKNPIYFTKGFYENRSQQGEGMVKECSALSHC